MRDHLSLTSRRLDLGLKGAGTILLLVVVGLVAVSIVVPHLLVSVIPSQSTLFASQEDMDVLQMAVSRVLSPCATFLVTWGSLKLRFRGTRSFELFREFGFVSVSKVVLLGSLCGGVAYQTILKHVLIPLFPSDTGLILEPNSLFVSSLLPIALKMFGGVLLAPIAEEFLFRGVLYKALAQHWNKVVSIIVVSLVFSLLHPNAISSGNWLMHVSLFVFPLLLALSREFTGSLGSPILLHAGYNLSEYVGHLYE